MTDHPGHTPVFQALGGRRLGLVLATRDERARATYRGLDVEYEFFG